MDEITPVTPVRDRDDARWGRFARGREAVLSSDHPYLWFLPVVILLLFIGIYPLIYNVYNSFREFKPMTGAVEPVGLENWARLLHDDRVRGALG
ncbi:MAG: hypothetical protein M3411_01655, partial [Chloroflexota bacterium]|nr:hypothetical protein [Chloroflexota bacterium]